MYFPALAFICIGTGIWPATTPLPIRNAIAYQAASTYRLSYPKTSSAGTAKDPLYGVQFTDYCAVDIRDRGETYTRFSIHVPDLSFRPLTSKIASFMAILWQMANERFGARCARLRAKTIDVWIMRTGEAGGELKQENLYVYNINADRSGLEWTRELAHEYGHYLLPGAFGYSEPESWSNGVLGERLFLGWLADDVKNSRIDPEDLPFVKQQDLETYALKQPLPLIERIRTNGVNYAVLSKKDHFAMDAFTALILYIDRTYGSAAVMELLEYLPHDQTAVLGGVPFLRAFYSWLSSKKSFDTRLPSNRPIMMYFPSGEYSAMRLPSGSAQKVAAPVIGKGMKVTIKTAAWTPIKYIDPSPEVRLRWTRTGDAPLSVGANK